MAVIDLSHCIASDMPVWPGSSRPELRPLASIVDEGFSELYLSMSTHTGTHIDAPAHVIAGGSTLDAFDVGMFHGPGAVVAVPAACGNAIALSDLMPYRSRIEACEFLLLRTGWSRWWGTGRYDGGYPVLAAAAAGWLSGIGLKAIGIDAPSFDAADSAELPVHRSILGRGILLIENLTNLDPLPDSGFTISAFPLPIRRGEAAPARVVAFC